MFSSVNQLKKHKPSILCDVVSLMFVCYYFVENGLPWTDYADLKMAKDPTLNLYELETFKQLRLDLEEQFRDQFRQSLKPLGQIFDYLFELIDR